MRDTPLTRLQCWGGSILTCTALQLPHPQLLSYHPWLNYGAIHLFISLLFSSYTPLSDPSSKVMDTIFPILDAVTRTGAIEASLSAVRNHPNPAYSGSLFLQLLIGAVASAGGGVTASTLNLWSPSWALSTPPFLNNPTLLSTLDIWSGSLAALIYGFLTASHTGYGPWIAHINGGKEGAMFTDLGARAVVVLVLTGCYGWRVGVTHYGRAKKVVGNKGLKEKKVQ